MISWEIALVVRSISEEIIIELCDYQPLTWKDFFKDLFNGEEK